jgi:hypothetical protein
VSRSRRAADGSPAGGHDDKEAALLEAEATAHRAVDEALGERGAVWWGDGSPDLNRHKEGHSLCQLVRETDSLRPSRNVSLPKAAILDLDGTLLDSVDLRGLVGNAWPAACGAAKSKKNLG